METVLIGRFENGQMVSALPSRIIKERCHRGIKEIKIAKPKSDAPRLTYKRPDRLHMGDQPKVLDPFDRSNIYIKTGEMGDGIFAKKNITNGDIIAYYSGHLCDTEKEPLFTRNQTMDKV